MNEEKLGTPDPPNGEMDTVVKRITVALDEYDLWKSIKVIGHCKCEHLVNLCGVD